MEGQHIEDPTEDIDQGEWNNKTKIERPVCGSTAITKKKTNQLELDAHTQCNL